MPIYAYRCTNCGHAQDVLQKISDPLLTVCPNCGQPTFAKQVTAAGFQLKGSGWYVTDFRNDGKGAKKDADKPGADKEGGETKPAGVQAGGGDAAKAGDRAGDKASDRAGDKAAPSPAPASAAPAPAPSPAPSSPAKTPSSSS